MNFNLLAYPNNLSSDRQNPKKKEKFHGSKISEHSDLKGNRRFMVSQAPCFKVPPNPLRENTKVNEGEIEEKGKKKEEEEEEPEEPKEAEGPEELEELEESEEKGKKKEEEEEEPEEPKEAEGPEELEESEEKGKKKEEEEEPEEPKEAEGPEELEELEESEEKGKKKEEEEEEPEEPKEAEGPEELEELEESEEKGKKKEEEEPEEPKEAEGPEELEESEEKEEEEEEEEIEFTEGDMIPIGEEDKDELDRENLPPVPNNGIDTRTEKFRRYKKREVKEIAEAIMEGETRYRFKIRWYGKGKYHIKIPIVEEREERREPFSIKVPERVRCVGWTEGFKMPKIKKAKTREGAEKNAGKFIEKFYRELNKCTQKSNNNPRRKLKYSARTGGIIREERQTRRRQSIPRGYTGKGEGDPPIERIKFYGLTIKVNGYGVEEIEKGRDKLRAIYRRLIDPRINRYPLLRYEGEPAFYMIIEVGSKTGLVHGHAIGVYNFKVEKRQRMSSYLYWYYYISRVKEFEKDDIQIYIGTDNRYHKEIKSKEEFDNWINYMEKDNPTWRYGEKELVLRARDMYLE